MKHITMALVLLAVTAWSVGCGGSPGKKASDAYLSGMNKIATAVEKVDDEESAKEAADVIASVRKDMERISAELEGMSETEKKALTEKHAEEFKEAEVRMTTAMQKLILKPHLMGIIGEEMGKMPDMR